MNQPFEAGSSGPLCESAPKTDAAAEKNPTGLAPDVSRQAPSQFSSGEIPPDVGAKAAEKSSYSSLCTPPDGILALLFFGVGLLYVQTIFLSFSLAGTALFCAAYLGAILCFARFLNKPLTRAGIFWICACGLLALSFVYDSSSSFTGVKLMLLHLFAIYTALVLLGGLADGRTSDALPADCIRGAVILPFGNFFALFAALGAFLFKKKKRLGLMGGVLAGVLLCIPLLAVIFPLLQAADSSFGALWQLVTRWRWDVSAPEFILRLCAGLLVAQYLFGLCFGAARGRCTKALDRPALNSLSAQMRVMPASTETTVLWILSAVYVLFMCVQAKVLFSAFGGILPDGFSSYAEYARQGFFELCRVAAINLAVLCAGRVLSRTSVSTCPPLRRAEGLLCLMTFCLIASAAGRMLLYIDAYGLTIKRIGTLLLLAFFAVLFALLLLSARRPVAVMRIAVIVFVAGFVLFALSWPQNWINRWNTAFGYTPQVGWTDSCR